MLFRQMSLLSGGDNKGKPSQEWRLFTDGASRGNPGPAGAGIYLLQGEQVILEQGFFLGYCTNNQAEYIALLLGLCQASTQLTPGDSLMIMLDSELIVRHILGIYKVRDEQLKGLYTQVMQLLKGVSYTIKHIVRSENTIADRLANQGIETKNVLPEALRTYCPCKESVKKE